MNGVTGRKVLTLLSVGTLIGMALSGCAPEFQDDACESNSDCFQDEVCMEGVCRVGSGGLGEGDSGMMGPDGGGEGDTRGQAGTIQTVVVTPDPVEVGEGRTMTLKATLLDSRGNVVDPADAEIKWTTLDDAVATVSGNAPGDGGEEDGDGEMMEDADAGGGKMEPETRPGIGWVTGRMTGKTTIKAKVGELEGEAEVEVVQVPVNSVEVAPFSTVLQVGEATQLEATPVDVEGTTLPERDVDWTSRNDSVASVDSMGNVTGHAEGQTEIVATSEGKTGIATVTVRRPSVGGLKLDPTDPPALKVGEAVQLNAVPTDGQGSALCPESEWSSTETPCGERIDWQSTDTEVADVDNSGLVTGKTSGSVAILALVDGHHAVATVEVTESNTNQPPQAEATAPKSTYTVGDTVPLDASGSSDPEGDMLNCSWTLTTPSGSSAMLSNDVSCQPDFSADVPGMYTATVTVTDSQGQTDTDSVTLQVNPMQSNNPPQATIKMVSSPVTVGNAVMLDASVSSDPDGDTLIYTWSIKSKPSGSSAMLTGVNGPTNSITPDVEGTYVIEVVVDDGMATATTTVSFNAKGAQGGNTPPTVDAGTYGTTAISGGQVTVQLQGMATDPDQGQTLSYTWSIESKPMGLKPSEQPLVNNPNTLQASATFKAPGEYFVALEVSDGQVAQPVKDSAQIKIVANKPPVADATVASSTVKTQTQVVLDGSGSSDPEGQTLTYKWEFVSKPSGSSAMIMNPTVAQPTLTPDVKGAYDVKVTVTDPQGATDTATVTVNAVDNLPPIADAGSRQSIQAGGTANLDGSNSADPENGTLSYSWTVTQEPMNATYSWSGQMTAKPSLTIQTMGNYTVELMVTDPKGNTDTDTTTIEVTGQMNQAPTAAINVTNAPITQGMTVQLDGTGSSDPEDGAVSSYTWTMVSKPAGSSAVLSSTTGAQVTFPADATGQFEVKLEVTDSQGKTASTVQTIVVSSP